VAAEWGLEATKDVGLERPQKYAQQTVDLGSSVELAWGFQEVNE